MKVNIRGDKLVVTDAIKNYIEDKFPTEAFTAKDFGKIQINNFSFDKIGKIRNKYLEDK